MAMYLPLLVHWSVLPYPSHIWRRIFQDHAVMAMEVEILTVHTLRLRRDFSCANGEVDDAPNTRMNFEVLGWESSGEVGCEREGHL